MLFKKVNVAINYLCVFSFYFYHQSFIVMPPPSVLLIFSTFARSLLLFSPQSPFFLTENLKRLTCKWGLLNPIKPSVTSMQRMGGGGGGRRRKGGNMTIRGRKERSDSMRKNKGDKKLCLFITSTSPYNIKRIPSLTTL